MLFISREGENAVPPGQLLVSKDVGSSVSLDHPVGLAFPNGLARPILDSGSTLNNSFSFIWEAVVNIQTLKSHSWTLALP